MMSIAVVLFHEIQQATGWEKNRAELKLASLLLHLAKRLSLNQDSVKLAIVKKYFTVFRRPSRCLVLLRTLEILLTPINPTS